MDLNIIKGLVYNFALLLMLCVIYEVRFLLAHRWARHLPVINGILVSIIGICIMSLPLDFTSGTRFDARTVLISVTALIFGITPTVIASAVLIVFRLLAGGEGLLVGGLIILSSAVIGLLWRRRLEKLPAKRKLPDIYLLGLAVHIAMVACMLLLPWPTAMQAMQGTALPIVILYPLGTVLLSALLLHQKERDESARRIMEAELRYTSIFHDSLAVMLLIDPQSGAIVDANPAARRFYGWDEAALKSMNISQINVMDREEIAREMKRAETGGHNFFLFRHRKADGQTADVEVYSSPIGLNGKTILYSIVHDVSLRMQAENARQESEQRFRSLVEGAPEAIFIETQGHLVFANQAAVRLFGATSEQDLLGTRIAERLSDETVIFRLDETPVPVEITSVPIVYNEEQGLVVFARDISERKLLERERQEMEAQMRQQQKLEAIGTLAGGVAHEINNPINGIMNYAQLIIEESAGNTTALEFAAEIIHETQRISTIVKNLLQFSRQEKESHSLASIHDIVDQTMSLIRTVLRKDQIELKVSLDEDLPRIRCRSQQIQQVLMNLLTNARDALNEKYPGFHEDKGIVLTCRQVVQDSRLWLRLIVRDNGMGIPQNVRTRIYEPFFSTKPRDIGTGLGLSINFGIVRDHGGRMSFETEEGQFTEFAVDLPAEDRSEDQP